MILWGEIRCQLLLGFEVSIDPKYNNFTELEAAVISTGKRAFHLSDARVSPFPRVAHCPPTHLASEG